MTILPIRLFGDPVLKEKGQPVTDFGANLQLLVDNMVDTMLLGNGVGLAAAQVGVQLRLFVYDLEDGTGRHVVCNPELSEFSEETVVIEEGCLSLPGVYVGIERPQLVTCSWQDEHGDSYTASYDGLLSRLHQHETDHCDGIWHIDRAGREQRKKALRALRQRFPIGETSYMPEGDKMYEHPVIF